MTPAEPLRVAVATENSQFDGALYVKLLELLLQRPVEGFYGAPPKNFSGRPSLRGNLGLLVAEALSAGVRHLLVGIDNDGGSARRLEHNDEHTPEHALENPNDACSTCWLLHLRGDHWEQLTGFCLVVPVQTFEAWLLYARGEELKSSWSRSHLKKRCYGSPLPDVRERRRIAEEALTTTESLSRLRQLGSFQCFEQQLAVTFRHE